MDLYKVPKWNIKETWWCTDPWTHELANVEILHIFYISYEKKNFWKITVSKRKENQLKREK